MQQLTSFFKHKDTHSLFKITALYARCSALDRLELCEDLELMANNTNYPWLVGGDFKTIMDESEKLGGLPVTQSEVNDFV
uniref:Putative ovule protein n=1 Tax=Solanum chacoense TaxID=4108 RepID=A0A0V0GRB2_SOLCH